jgi:uncharacterized protein YcbK (DUF882 family)
MPRSSFPGPRRKFLVGTAGLAVATVGAPWAARAGAVEAGPRRLAFVHTHTLERVELAYADGERYDPAALGSLNRFLRDHYTGEVGVLDPRLFDMLHVIGASLGARGPYEVISGYRCPATNERLRGSRGGGVARHSLHMEGRAIDVRLPGVALTELRDAAVSLRRGGVGFYPGNRFVHLDTGRVRTW